MDSRTAAHVLSQIASYLELNGENTFKVRAYEGAARGLLSLNADEVACVAVYAGEIDEALEYFEAACVSRAPILPYFEVKRRRRDVGSGPRFSAIGRRHGLRWMD